MSNKKQDWHGVLLIRIALILRNISDILGKQNLLKERISNVTQLYLFQK